MEDFSLKKTSPNIPSKNKKSMQGTFDMVLPMEFLYIRILKAMDLFDPNNGYEPYVEIRVRNCKALTKLGEKKPNPEWNNVFAFNKNNEPFNLVEILMKNKGPKSDGVKGRILLNGDDAPKRAPPDSPLAPQWYKLEDCGEVRARGELMLAVWIGTQADEAFTEAFHSDAAGVAFGDVVNTKSKVYMSPKLWYLRVNVFQALNLELRDKNRRPDVFVKAVFGDITAKTKISLLWNNLGPQWQEDLMFVAAEPFENDIVLTVEEKIDHNKEEVVGRCVIPLRLIERRFIGTPVIPMLVSLTKPVRIQGADGSKTTKWQACKSQIQLRACLDGGYHVLDEPAHYISDMRPTAKELWRKEIGVLELGILNANALPPMKKKDGGQGRTDAYCVAKYGPKWVRTRTIINSPSPKWNEQYTWSVYDPCTVITVVVFDNCHFQGPDVNKGSPDTRIGKVRIRVSTLETNKIYTHMYPLLVLHPRGLMKMGEIQLAIRFTSSLSLLNSLQLYTRPIFPEMHYTRPISFYQQENLRHQAIRLESMKLSRSEPALRKEVVEYMLDYDLRTWSKRRTLANCERIKAALSGLLWALECLRKIRSWKNRFISGGTLLFLLVLIFYPNLMLPSICLILCYWIAFVNYKTRPRNPPHMDPILSFAQKLAPQDLEEELDGFPSSCNNIDDLKFRYERLRTVAGHIQVLLGDLATQLERIQSLFNWRDPRATTLFLTICVISMLLLFAIPVQVQFCLIVLYIFRPPQVRGKAQSAPLNFLRRLPAKTDSLL